jgi:hypothetical protein
MENSNPNPRRPLIIILLITFIFVGGGIFYKYHGSKIVAPPNNNANGVDSLHIWLVVAPSPIIFDEWTTPTSTELNDSVLYASTGAYSAYTAANGTCKITDNNYTAGNLITMEGYTHGEVAGKIFNQELSGSDPNVTAPVFNMVPLQASPYLIPDTVIVTDMSGNPRVGYTVQFKLGRTNVGTEATTNSNGVAVYGTYLSQGENYTVQANGSAGASADIPVSTTPLWGSGKFCSMTVYIRY